ncbi:MAG: hypothetical protein AAGD38_19920 [Acidobacteriota bacterium]
MRLHSRLFLIPILYLALTAQGPTGDPLYGTWEGGFHVPPETFTSLVQLPQGVQLDLTTAVTQTFRADGTFDSKNDITLKVLQAGNDNTLRMRMTASGTWALEGETITQTTQSQEIVPVGDMTEQYLQRAPGLMNMFRVPEGHASTYTLMSVDANSLNLYLDDLGADLLMTRSES